LIADEVPPVELEVVEAVVEGGGPARVLAVSEVLPKVRLNLTKFHHRPAHRRRSEVPVADGQQLLPPGAVNQNVLEVVRLDKEHR
jgi:hypothetical protein